MEFINTFAGSPMNRMGNERRNADWLKQQMDDPESCFLPLWQLRALMMPGELLRIGWCQRADVQPFINQGATVLLLGQVNGRSHFAVDVSAAGPKKANAPLQDYGKWIDVRSAAASCSGPDAAILAQSRSMLDWHARHGFCSVCGQPSRTGEAGYSRKCSDEDCGAMHFPRTDPVTIMMVLDGERCLLGRQKIFAPNSYSALAGFMEPGETIEETVRREVFEEAGIRVGDVRYIFSQPWPFPSSLMMGCFGTAETTEINVDTNELEEARWFSRDEVAEMVNNWQDQTKLRMPAPLAIAHQLAQAWLRGD
ncbi:MAG: NAD(+) diphosphatase [Alphaproteobacteria bacterium]|nr:NAD(+) diphosphatase [Alphaproteobacteria bacterium]